MTEGSLPLGEGEWRGSNFTNEENYTIFDIVRFARAVRLL